MPHNDWGFIVEGHVDSLVLSQNARSLLWTLEESIGTLHKPQVCSLSDPSRHWEVFSTGTIDDRLCRHDHNPKENVNALTSDQFLSEKQ